VIGGLVSDGVAGQRHHGDEVMEAADRRAALSIAQRPPDNAGMTNEPRPEREGKQSQR
jgi:hypothetical protein